MIATDPGDLLEVAETYVDRGSEEVVFQSSSPDREQFRETVAETVFPALDGPLGGGCFSV